MNLIFTKNLERKVVSEQLGNHFSYDFVEVIRITHLEVPAFDLKNHALIFSSVNGVESFFKNGFEPVEDCRSEAYNRIFVVGQKTKAALRRHGFGAFKTLRYARELSDFIMANLPREKFLHFCGNLSLDILDRRLPLQNISYRKISVYRTDLLFPKIQKPYDAVAFFSPSGVRSFLKHNSVQGKLLFSIGYTTEKELKKYTDTPVITSSESNAADLLKLIRRQTVSTVNSSNLKND